MATLTLQEFKDLLGKEGQTLTLVEVYSITTKRGGGPIEEYRKTAGINPGIGIMKVEGLRNEDFALIDINIPRRETRGCIFISYPDEPGARLEGKTLKFTVTLYGSPCYYTYTLSIV